MVARKIAEFDATEPGAGKVLSAFLVHADVNRRESVRVNALQVAAAAEIIAGAPAGRKGEAYRKAYPLMLRMGVDWPPNYNPDVVEKTVTQANRLAEILSEV